MIYLLSLLVVAGQVTIPFDYVPPERYQNARGVLQEVLNRGDKSLTISVGKSIDEEKFLREEALQNEWDYVALPLDYRYSIGSGPSHRLAKEGVFDFKWVSKREWATPVERSDDYVPLPPKGYR